MVGREKLTTIRDGTMKLKTPTQYFPGGVLLAAVDGGFVPKINTAVDTPFDSADPYTIVNAVGISLEANTKKTKYEEITYLTAPCKLHLINSDNEEFPILDPDTTWNVGDKVFWAYGNSVSTLNKGFWTNRETIADYVVENDKVRGVVIDIADDGGLFILFHSLV